MELVAWERRINSNLSAIQRAGCASVTYKDRFALILGGRFRDTFYLDCWSYDTSTGSINALSSGPENCHARAYHTATLVDGVVWVIGGSDDQFVHADTVWCFDVKTRVWTQPKLRGSPNLLRRTAHGACVHPTTPGCILLFGGYGIIQSTAGGGGGGGHSLEPEWLSDLVIVDTRNNTVHSVNSSGKAPISRAYHSFSAVGNLCVALFGRTENKSLLAAKKSIALYDAQTGTWLDVSEKDIKGTIPQVRSSHRACNVAITTSGGGGGSSSIGGVVIFGGAPPIASKKVDRLSDVHFLKISNAAVSHPTTNRRAAGASNTSKKAYQLEWTKCGEGAGPDADGTHWPLGRAAHAQEFVNGKLCLFGGYCSHERYCTDVWEGLVVVEGATTGNAAAAAVCNEAPAAAASDDSVAAAAAAAAAPKWRSSRGRVQNDNLLQNLQPSGTKRPRGGATVALTTKTTQQQQTAVLLPLPLATAKRLKKDLTRKNYEEDPSVPAPGTSSPGVGPGARRISALELEVRNLQEAVVTQRAKEAALLRDSSTAKSDVFKLKEELKRADEHWRKAGAERDDWKMKFNDLKKYIQKAEVERDAAVEEGATAQAKAQEALRRWKATATIAEQKQKAIEAAAAENAQLQSNTTALQGALDQATTATEKERQLRISIQEQNSVLQIKMATAETEKDEFKRQFQMSSTSLESFKMQWEAERSRLERELSLAKNAVSENQRELDAAKRQEGTLQSKIQSLEQNEAILRGKMQRLEGELRNAEEERERGVSENKKLRDDLHRLQREMDDKQRSIDTEFDEIHRALQRARDTNAASDSRRQ